MNYDIEFTDVADMEIQNILIWIMGRSPDYADRWQEGLEISINSLTIMPGRCPLAPENNEFDVEVRQLLYGVYRILFMLADADDDGESDTVRILHARHGAQQHLRRAE